MNVGVVNLIDEVEPGVLNENICFHEGNCLHEGIVLEIPENLGNSIFEILEIKLLNPRAFVENVDNGEIVLIWTGVSNFNELVLKPESNEGVIFVMGTELISVLKLFELNGS